MNGGHRFRSKPACPPVFAAGDCRSGTAKRVAFAVGDGAMAVSAVHNLLAQATTRPGGYSALPEMSD